MKIYNLMFFTSMYSLLIGLCSIPFLLLFVRPKFDKLFRHKKYIGDPQVPLVSAGLRASRYAICIITNLNRKKPNPKTNYYFRLFGEYNFRANANVLQILICYIFHISGIVALSSGLIFLIIGSTIGLTPP